MTPQDGEFWIVELAGSLSVGQCYRVGGVDEWDVIGCREPVVTATYRSFRAVRKIDMDASLDAPASALLAVLKEVRDAIEPERGIAPHELIIPADLAVRVRAAVADGSASLDNAGGRYRVEHDGFEGEVIGHYTTREGKRGVVLQQIGTRVVHVYGEKWLTRSTAEA